MYISHKILNLYQQNLSEPDSRFQIITTPTQRANVMLKNTKSAITAKRKQSEALNLTVQVVQKIFM